MFIPLAYISVILIWSTTPLAVEWSIASFSPIGALTARMMLATSIALAGASLFHKSPLNVGKNWRLYALGSLGLFPNMPLVYWALTYIPSGLVSVLFGLSPFMVGVISSRLLDNHKMGALNYAAIFISFCGLGVIFLDQLALGPQAVFGVILMLVSNLCFATSSVLIKRFGSETTAVNQMTGSLLFSLPGLMLTWIIVDGSLPIAITDKSISAIIYLALIGSLVGIGAYIYLLKNLPATTVSLIPLMTPINAILLGATFNGEPVTQSIMFGTSLIIIGLAIFSGTPQAWAKKILRERRFS